MEIEQALQQIGLTKQETEIYLNTLKLGIAKASQVAQKTQIRRGAVYYSLKLLKEKGLVSEVISAGVQHFKAISPERIIEIIKEDKNKQLEAITSIIPSLKSLQSTAIQKPTIEVFEGYGGFKTIFARIIEKSPKELKCYMSSKILTYLPHFHEQFRMKRSKKKIFIKTITENTPEIQEIKKLDKKELRETRFYNKFFEKSETLQYILEDSVIIIKANEREQAGIEITDKNFTELQKAIFEANWRISE
jgi:sugar-specific transcriptional regulator TrmB